MLNTLQYLIVDEILLARVLESKKETFHNTEFRDDRSMGDVAEEYIDDDGDDDNVTGYDTRKGRPIIV